jgi:hypothetical protein
MFRISVCVCAFLVLACFVMPMAAQQPAAASANAAVPSMVNFSGVLTGVNNKPLTGTVGVTFYLYQESQGGSPLWMETQNVQPDKAGHYSVALGSTSSQGLPANVFASGEARWLGVQVQGQAEQPRVLLMSVPYALKALDAETIGGRPASSFMLAPTSSAGGKNANVPPGTITGSGTADFVPLFTGATTIGNSKIFQTVGGNVGIGTTTPAAKLDVAGTGDVRDTLTLFPKLTHPSLSIHGTAFEVSNTGKVTFVAGQTFPGTGTVTSVASGAGLTGGPITHSGTLSIATGGVTNAMLAHSSLTVTANSPLNGGGSVSLGGSTSLGLKSCGANQILEFVSGAWACVNPATGTVTSVATGLGLTGGPITSSGTLSINTSVVPQLAGANSFTNNNAITANNSSTTLTVTNSSNGDAIDVNENGSGAGLFVNGGDIGLLLENSFIPIIAESPSTGIEAIFAEAANNGDFIAGIFGEGTGSTARTLGVEGVTGSTTGAGVYGENVNQSSTGSSFGTGSGVWGDAGTSNGAYGVVGTADDRNAIVAENNSPSTYYALWANELASAGFPFGATGPGGYCNIDGNGDLFCSGTITPVAPVDGGSRKVSLYGVAAPENWFEDAGSGQLSSGEAVINLEPLFGQTVNTEMEYHVFLTPNGDCNGLYVTQKTATSFVVRELKHGTSSIAFDYRIMAKRKGHENVRMAEAAHIPPQGTHLSTPIKARVPTKPAIANRALKHPVAQLNPVVKH